MSIPAARQTFQKDWHRGSALKVRQTLAAGSNDQDSD